MNVRLTAEEKIILETTSKRKGFNGLSDFIRAAALESCFFPASRMGERSMNYPVVIHKDEDSDYGVTVPDLPGCFSAGRTVDEALAMTKEAIELHLEGLIAEGSAVPRPGRIEKHRQHPDYQDGTWAVVSIDPESLRAYAKRINVTIPERILDAIDRFSQQHGQTRSGFLAEAAVAYMSGSAEQSSGAAQRGANRLPAADKTPKPRRKAGKR